MAENDSSQEKTEDATDKKVKEARKKGTVTRSKELTTMFLMFGSVLLFMTWGKNTAVTMQNIFQDVFIFADDINLDNKKIFAKMYDVIIVTGKVMLPFFIIMLIMGILSTLAVGGYNFTLEAIQFKLEKLDPISGLKRMFSVKSLVELVKSILKVFVISVSFYIVINMKILDVFQLDKKPFEVGLTESLDIILFSLLIMSLSLIFIALIDVPFQIFSGKKDLKMSKQEVKDEHKDVDGNPEVKHKIRRAQREIAKRRMMSEVPKADVIITNPTHYAVALKYNESMNTPIVVAKGADIIAQMIRKVATNNNVPLVRVPAVARSLYYNVELEQEIPSGLYIAVAKILAYVHDLRLYKTGVVKKYPVLAKDIDVPKDLQR